MEQIVPALFEQGALIRDGSLKLTRAVGELTVPTTVQALLGSRIDRLAADSKEMLQTLAVTGKEFALDVVREATKKPDDELERILHDLQSAEFIYEQPSVGGARYTFKHALTQEVAYNSVLGERRKQLHERVGAAIERLYAERLDDHLEELARHYGRGSDAGKAGDYLTRAGQQAAQRGLYRESLAHVRDAFARLGEVADPNLRLRRELPLQITLGNVLKFTEGSAKPGAEPAFLRAYQLCEAAGDAVSAVDRMSALRGLAGFYMDSGNYEAGIDTGRQMLALAQRQSDPRLLAAAHSFLGFFSMSRLDFPAARSHCERALELMRETPSRAGAISDVTFSAAITLSHLPVPLAYLGFSDQAAVRAREAIALGQGSPHEVICRANIGAFFALVRNWQLAQEHSEAALAIEIENGLFAMVGFTKATHGLAIAMLGDLDRGIEEIREALSDKSANAARMRAGGLRFLASACLEAGRAEEGLAALDEFDAFVKRPLIADVARGELLLIRNPADEEQAERLFRHVIELAREQSVPFFELHATTSLARLLKRQGKIAEARAKLAEIYNWFTEGFEFADLRDAKALLDELGT
jgi:tetratricopeptide (TPR) repeat protein